MYSSCVLAQKKRILKKNIMAKTPRFDAYYRLISRLYEALYMLRILGRVRGPHRIANLDVSTARGVRRRFLKNLAFLCDYTKGGPSTAALAVEARSDCNMFWLSSNEGPSEAVLDFLKSMIQDVKASSALSGGQRPEAENILILKCIEFARKRVTKQAKGLSSSVRLCLGYLATEMANGNGNEAFSS